MEPAPLHSLANGPESGAAFWLRAQDDVRLRMAYWPGGAKGTVLLFPGRTEYIEKYGPAALELGARGFSTVTLDWRGQGLADRLLPNGTVGHVESFADYQRDVTALMDAVADLGIGQPLFLLAHSMGGAIGLRALTTGLPVRAATFSAPMWDIRFPPFLWPVAWGLSAGSRALGLGARFAPGTAGESYVTDIAFDDNALTNDPDMYAWLRSHIRDCPELALAGPSLGWLHEALREGRALSRLPSPGLPALTFLGGAETIVSPGAIRNRMRRWPGGRLHFLPGVKHEPMMDTPATRATVFDETAALFGAQT
ncbi:lysophospholipase [Rhodovulum imhoffii]|uniref:Lysophospholipase n=1 Tax=Rhodovulum imhoffii TaxID=365340 RepID=A0A2T5BR59_9RHOB|nr:alpha/beta hydrolase [Rhodovulum imhoffii]MBK5934397.1 lysophospholipase [Rhodovulum imhoffii]PTN01743.1 lysophospholipase [Rhodovulum imhoffii]